MSDTRQGFIAWMVNNRVTPNLLMLVLFVGWIIYYFVALWKFRATNNPKADYKGVKTKTITNSIEGAVIVAELVLIVVATYFWNFYVNKPTDFSEASVVRVTAEQFAWNARYPGADGKLGAQSKTLVSAANQKTVIVEDTGHANAHYSWCFNKYKSYRMEDNSFMSFSGYRKPCISPYY